MVLSCHPEDSVDADGLWFRSAEEEEELSSIIRKLMDGETIVGYKGDEMSHLVPPTITEFKAMVTEVLLDPRTIDGLYSSFLARHFPVPEVEYSWPI